MREGPQYTKCVEPEAFTTKGATIAWAALGAVLGAGIAYVTFPLLLASAAAAGLVGALKIILDWTVNGKLICLYNDDGRVTGNCERGTVCAFGTVLDTEDVGEDKNLFEDVDNDYSMNLLLAPMLVKEFQNEIELAEPVVKLFDDAETKKKLWHKATYERATRSGPQSHLITKPKFVEERNNAAFGIWGPYFRTIVYNVELDIYEGWTAIIGKRSGNSPSPTPIEDTVMEDLQYKAYLLAKGWKESSVRKIDIPVFHCEFEGSRQKDVLDALNIFTLGGEWCKKNVFFGFLCTVLSAVLAPIAILAALIAWASAKDGNAADAIKDGGTVSAGDQVIARGRWVYDGGHDGWNEMHATRHVQKTQFVPTDGKKLEDHLKQWCESLCEVPVGPVGTKSNTPSQEVTAKNQSEPKNIYLYHPLIDSCARASQPEPYTGIR